MSKIFAAYLEMNGAIMTARWEIITQMDLLPIGRSILFPLMRARTLGKISPRPGRTTFT